MFWASWNLLKIGQNTNILISCINFFWIVTIQIQTRHGRDHIGKEKTTISLMEWKLIMFDHECVKTAKVMWSLSTSFRKSNLKSWWPKKYEVKGPKIYNSNQFMASQNLLYYFFKWILNAIFSPMSSQHYELFPRALNTIESQDCNGYPCTKYWIEKSLSLIFKIGFLMLKIDFKKNFSKIETTKKNLVRFYLTSKFCKHQILVPWAFRG